MGILAGGLAVNERARQSQRRLGDWGRWRWGNTGAARLATGRQVLVPEPD